MNISFWKLFLFTIVLLTAVKLNTQNNQELINVSTTQIIGDVVLFTLPIATLGTSFIIGDSKGAWQFTKGLLLTEAITYCLKLSINKPRPDLSNNNSFPSGHTSSTFHSAGFVHKRYGFKYSIPSYILASFTAFSRIDSNKHDLVDIISGAVIGLGSNLLLTTKYQQKHIELTFNSDNNNFLIGFMYKF